MFSFVILYAFQLCQYERFHMSGFNKHSLKSTVECQRVCGECVAFVSVIIALQIFLSLDRITIFNKLT